MIHGLHEPYNDVLGWKYGDLLNDFGIDHEIKTFKVRTCEEWDKVLKGRALNDALVPQVSDEKLAIVWQMMR